MGIGVDGGEQENKADENGNTNSEGRLFDIHKEELE
jgi:hypothetical protein